MSETEDTLPPEEPLPPGGNIIEPAGFWLRAIALFLDSLIVSIASSIILAIVPFGLAPCIVGWLYYALCESSRYQATFGKRALGLIVTNEYYETITFARASGRFFAKILSYLTLCIGFFMAAFTERKQALHDMVARTLVLKVR